MSDNKDDSVPTWAVIAPQNINVIRPCAHNYIVEYNGEALWQWRDLQPYPATYLNAMNESLKHLGYAICSTADRVGTQLKTTTYRHNKKMRKITNSKIRKKTISNNWLKIEVQEDEMSMVPENVIKERENLIKEKDEKMEKLQKELDEMNGYLEHQSEQVLELLEEALSLKENNNILEKDLSLENYIFKKDLKNKGKKIPEVQCRQKCRKIKQFR